VVVAITQMRTFEDRSGEGFHMNSICIWVSRT